MEGEAPACVKDWDEVVDWGGAADTSVVWLSDVLLCQVPVVGKGVGSGCKLCLLYNTCSVAPQERWEDSARFTLNLLFGVTS